MISAAKVKALMRGRFNVSYGDVNELAAAVLRHRLKLNFEAIAERVSADDIVKSIVAEVGKRFGIAGEARRACGAEEERLREEIRQKEKGRKDESVVLER